MQTDSLPIVSLLNMHTPTSVSPRCTQAHTHSHTCTVSLPLSLPQTHSIFSSYPGRLLYTSQSPSHMNEGNRGQGNPMSLIMKLNIHSHQGAECICILLFIHPNSEDMKC